MLSKQWAYRQRHTNAVVRAMATHVFGQQNITAKQLLGLSQLTWITNSRDLNNTSYIQKVKIPALSKIMERDFTGFSLNEVARQIARITQCPQAWLTQHTGFTNFYPVYRNSTLGWIEEHFDELLPMYRAAHEAQDDTTRRQLVALIQQMPRIPSPAGDRHLKTESLLSPTFYCLDPQIRFPLINGADAVKKLLKHLKVKGQNLIDQYDAVMRLYDIPGVDDASDIDQLLGLEEITTFLTTDDTPATRQPLTHKHVELTIKDERDVKVLSQTMTQTHRQRHNALTNRLLKALPQHTLLESVEAKCLFDALIKRYDGKHDLLIEAKSDDSRAQLRMAIGQLFDYWFTLYGATTPHLAILLPHRPDEATFELFAWREIHLIWFEGDQLCATKPLNAHIT